MRNMSFALTIPQIRDRTKDVTRRKGWSNLKPGDQFWAVERSMGLKKGEKVKKICLLECVRNDEEYLHEFLLMPPTRYGSQRTELEREGFSGVMSPSEFVTMFCYTNYRKSMTNKEFMEAKVNRIEFRYVEEDNDLSI